MFWLQSQGQFHTANVILSHSLCRDEASLAQWRTNAKHDKSQAAGRNKHFADYRIRISQVLERVNKGNPSRHFSRDGLYCSPEARTASFLVIVGSMGEPFADEGDAFLSVNYEGTYLNIIDVDDEAAARSVVGSAGKNENVQTAMFCMISRDYGMFDRAQAPQYFPPVDRMP